VIYNQHNIIMYIIGTLISMHTKPSLYAPYTVQLQYVNYVSQIFFFFFVAVTWSLILREELRLRVFENRVSRRMFGPKRDEVTGD
jgi:sensor histidine kinase YesM